jgi:hypothetical protein
MRIRIPLRALVVRDALDPPASERYGMGGRMIMNPLRQLRAAKNVLLVGLVFIPWLIQ